MGGKIGIQMALIKSVRNEIKKLIFILKNFGKFKFNSQTTVRENSILIVETNKYHGETLVGFCKYFQDLGYTVDVFITYENFMENPFCRYKSDDLRIFVATKKELKKWLKKKCLKNYDFIFFNSFIYRCIDYVENKFEITQPKYGILGIEHGIMDESKKKFTEIAEKYEQNRLFILSNIANIPRLNPHYFGDIIITPKNSDETVFIAVGMIKSKLKNHDMLIRAVESIVSKGIKNFKIIVVGSGKLKLPKNIKKYFEVRGRLNFSNMFEAIERSDFILGLLDLENQNHHKYLDGVASGAIQLSLGFKKPMVINKEFGKHYELSEENAILYDKNELENAMLRSIDLSSNDYLRMQNSLSNLAAKIYKCSLDNLKKSINSNKKSGYDKSIFNN